MKKILILGATSAIASATAHLWAQEKAELFLVGRNAERLQTIQQDLQTRYQVQVHTRVTDLNETTQHATLLEEVWKTLNTLDVALIAHGTLGDQKAGEQNFSVAEQELRTNFLNIVSLLTLLANQMETRKSGCIAVISSVAGDRGRQSNYIYGTAKGALTLFLQGLRNRLSRSQVHVLTLKPGFVDTPMTAHLKKGLLFVSPETIARGILKSIRKRKNEVYLPWFWFFIMGIIKNIPECIFKRLKL